MVSQIQAMRRAFDGLISSTVMEKLISDGDKLDLTSVPRSNAEVVIEKMHQCSFRHGLIPVVYAMLAKAAGSNDVEVTALYNKGLVTTDCLTPADTINTFSFIPTTSGSRNAKALRISVTATRIKGVRRSDSERYELTDVVIPVSNIEVNIDAIARAIYQVQLMHPTAGKVPATSVAEIKRGLRNKNTVAVNHRLSFYDNSRG